MTAFELFFSISFLKRVEFDVICYLFKLFMFIPPESCILNGGCGCCRPDQTPIAALDGLLSEFNGKMASLI